MSLGVVPLAISVWKPETAPQAIVMKQKGNILPATIGPVPSTNRLIANGDVAEINATSERLTQATHKLAEAMYQQASAQTGAAGAGQAPGGDASGNGTGAKKEKEGEVIDAEFVDVEDEKGKK